MLFSSFLTGISVVEMHTWYLCRLFRVELTFWDRDHASQLSRLSQRTCHVFHGYTHVAPLKHAKWKWHFKHWGVVCPSLGLGTRWHAAFNHPFGKKCYYLSAFTIMLTCGEVYIYNLKPSNSQNLKQWRLTSRAMCQKEGTYKIL